MLLKSCVGSRTIFFPITPAVWWPVSSVLKTRESQSLLHVTFSHKLFLMVPLLSSGKSGLQPECFCSLEYTQEERACIPSSSPERWYWTWYSCVCVCVMCVTLLVAWVRSSCVNHKLTPQHETGVTLRTVHRGTLIKNTHILLVFTNTNAGEWTWGSVTDWVHHEEEDHSFQEWGKKKGILMNVTLTWLLGPPLFAHMPIWHSITLRARPLNSFTQSNSENKGAVKAPFHLKRRGGEEPGVPAVASRVISPRKASTLERFKSPD